MIHDANHFAAEMVGLTWLLHYLPRLHVYINRFDTILCLAILEPASNNNASLTIATSFRIAFSSRTKPSKASYLAARMQNPSYTTPCKSRMLRLWIGLCPGTEITNIETGNFGPVRAIRSHVKALTGHCHGL